MIAGSDLVHETHTDPRVVPWIARQGARARRVASVCSGAFLLAEAGLLDGRRAATHWRYASRLAAMYPRITVDPDPIYVRDGNIYTSAGMTARHGPQPGSRGGGLRAAGRAGGRRPAPW